MHLVSYQEVQACMKASLVPGAEGRVRNQASMKAYTRTM